MWLLAKILAASEVTPQFCEVFHENLLYFFYGRPAYRRVSEESINTTPKAPAVIVIRSEAVQPVKRIYPFDSGAFPERYIRWLAAGMTLEDFALGDDVHMAQRHVGAFFGSNDNYLSCTPASSCTLGGAEFEVETLLRMYQDSGSGTVDDRRHAVELQVAHMVEIKAANIVAVVLPEECKDHPKVKALGAAGIESVGYRLVKHRPEREYQSELESIAISVQRRAGLL